MSMEMVIAAALELLFWKDFTFTVPCEQDTVSTCIQVHELKENVQGILLYVIINWYACKSVCVCVCAVNVSRMIRSLTELRVSSANTSLLNMSRP